MATIGTISSADRNNFIPVAGGDSAALTMEALTETFSRYDFTFQNSSVDGNIQFSYTTLIAGLLPNRTGIAGPYTFTAADCPLSVEWNLSIAGVPGTVTEIWRSFGTEIVPSRRLNVDPGFTAAGIVMRKGPRYTFLLSGTEYRGYVDYAPTGGHKPQCKVEGPVGGFVFPIRLGLRASFGDYIHVTDIMLGGNLGEKTIYSAAEKTADGITTHFHFRIFQNGILDGLPVDIDT